MILTPNNLHMNHFMAVFHGFVCESKWQRKLLTWQRIPPYPWPGWFLTDKRERERDSQRETDSRNKQLSQTKRIILSPVLPSCVLCLTEWTWLPRADRNSTRTLLPASPCTANPSQIPARSAFSIASGYIHSHFIPFANLLSKPPGTCTGGFVWSSLSLLLGELLFTPQHHMRPHLLQVASPAQLWLG